MWVQEPIKLSLCKNAQLQINASLVKHKDKYYCAYRSNHLFEFDSKSFLSELDINLQPVMHRRLLSGNLNSAFEDVRLFSHNDKLFALYTHLPLVVGKGFLWQFTTGIGLVDTEKGWIISQTSLRDVSTRGHEKNWVPYTYKSELFLISHFSPTLRILSVFEDHFKIGVKEYYNSETTTKTWDYGEIRGGTPLISPSAEFGDEWLYCFVHSSMINHNGYDRYYYFTAARFNPETKEFQLHGEPLGISADDDTEEYRKLWEKSNKCKLKVVFPMGIINYKAGAVISFGKDDCLSFVQFYTWTYIKSLFS